MYSSFFVLRITIRSSVETGNKGPFLSRSSVVTFCGGGRLRYDGKPNVNKKRNLTRSDAEGKWSPQRPVGCPGSSTWTHKDISDNVNTTSGLCRKSRGNTYPRPYPSRTTGANPPSSTAGLPSVDVDRMLWLIAA